MYNEQNIAKLSVTTIMSYVRKLPDTFTVVVVNDGSKDNTETILRGLLSEYSHDQYRVITHPVNNGYGAALKTGINFAIDNSYDYVVFIDSDLTNNPKYLKEFYKKMVEGYDYIKASRYGPGAGVVGVPWHRRFISMLGNKVARLLFGLPLYDLTNGFRAVKTDILGKIELTENGFAIIMEELFLTKPLVHSYAEVPYVLSSRTEGQGNTHFTYDVKTYFSYLKYAIKSISKRRPVV
jgi:dolichol-phosphate mannosyltransferase